MELKFDLREVAKAIGNDEEHILNRMRESIIIDIDTHIQDVSYYQQRSSISAECMSYLSETFNSEVDEVIYRTFELINEWITTQFEEYYKNGNINLNSRDDYFAVQSFDENSPGVIDKHTSFTSLWNEISNDEEMIDNFQSLEELFVAHEVDTSEGVLCEAVDAAEDAYEEAKNEFETALSEIYDKIEDCFIEAGMEDYDAKRLDNISWSICLNNTLHLVKEENKVVAKYFMQFAQNL